MLLIRGSGSSADGVGSAADAAVPTRGRGLVGGALAGVVAAAPAMWSSLLSAACLGCLGVSSATTAGVAAGAGVNLGGVLVGFVVLAAVIVIHVLRARRACAVGVRRRYLAVRIAAVVVAATASFASLQWLASIDAGPPGGPSPMQQLP